MVKVLHQYTYPEMQFLEELGFSPEIGRGGKFGPFFEGYTKGDVSQRGGWVSIELYPNRDAEFEEERQEGKTVFHLEDLAFSLPHMAEEQ